MEPGSERGSVGGLGEEPFGQRVGVERGGEDVEDRFMSRPVHVTDARVRRIQFHAYIVFTSHGRRTGLKHDT
ncbi:hypothetical protein GCM10023223_29240 [Stackebrandtia albiflava]